MPIWDIAVQTEGRPALRVLDYAATIRDPLLKQALEMDGFEEARHILFFANWAAWQRRRLPWWRRPFFLAKTAAVWAVLIRDRLVLARNMGSASKDTNFTASSESVGVEMSAAELIDICLVENERRMAGYDPRLLRPTTVPFVIRPARRFMRPRPSARAALEAQGASGR